MVKAWEVIAFIFLLIVLVVILYLIIIYGFWDTISQFLKNSIVKIVTVVRNFFDIFI